VAAVVEVGLVVDENRARRVADALRDRDVDAHLAHVGVDQSVGACDASRLARGDVGLRRHGLEAQVMRDGVLVGFVPVIAGSEDFDESQVIDAIARPVRVRAVAT
jgi:hypothetical protein